jgi:pimeloyl-ACP methyl ester carboxylesterase
VPYLERDGVRIHHHVTGPPGGGLPLLLSHGFGATAASWEPNLPQLSAGRPVITWDMRGHGRSDSPDDPGEYSHAECVADMAAVLDAHGAGRAVVGGLSLGGYLSLEFWLAEPRRVAALVLCATGPGFRSDTARAEWNDRTQATADRHERDGNQGLALAARGMLAQHNGRVIGALPSVDVPVLVLVGERDRAFHAAADYVAAKVPGAVKQVIPGAGHACNSDAPEAFDAAVLGFLRTSA